MATRPVVARTDEMGQYTVTCANLEENGGVRDVSQGFVVPRDVNSMGIAAIGNFDTSVTITLQFSIDAGASWQDCPDTNSLAAGTPATSVFFRAPLYRFAVTADGAADASNLTAVLACGR